MASTLLLGFLLGTRLTNLGAAKLVAAEIHDYRHRGCGFHGTWKVMPGLYLKSQGHVAVCSLKRTATYIHRSKASQSFGSNKVSVQHLCGCGEANDRTDPSLNEARYGKAVILVDPSSPKMPGESDQCPLLFLGKC